MWDILMAASAIATLVARITVIIEFAEKRLRRRDEHVHDETDAVVISEEPGGNQALQ